MSERKFLKIALATLLGIAVLATAQAGGKAEGSSGKAKALSEKKLVVGVTAGPHEQILEKVKEVAAKDGLEIQIKVFTEYVLPNVALAEGDLDINSFQHKPYLDKFKADRKLDIVEVANTVNFPMGVYSKKVKNLSELKEGAKVGLPNDPTNGARALILFQNAGLIKLAEGKGIKATVIDVVDNPKKLKLVELEASQIPRQLEELDAAAINTNFAIEHGYVPTRDSVFIEPSDSPWVNVIAVRTPNKDDPAVAKFVKFYRSPEVKEFIKTQFKGSAVASW